MNPLKDGRKININDENPIDNVLITIGHELGKVFYKLSFTPNIITLMSLIVTVIGCWYMNQQKYNIAGILIFVGCARRGKPEGGEEDVDPPIFLNAEPSHESIHFKEEKIRLNFNEYVKLKDVKRKQK